MARRRAGQRLSRLLIWSEPLLHLQSEVMKEYKRNELNWFGLIGFVWYGLVWFLLFRAFRITQSTLR